MVLSKVDKTSDKPDYSEEINPMGQPLLAHLIELRSRLVKSLVAILAGFIVAYGFAPEIYALLVRPLAVAGEAPHRLIYTGLTEAFVTYIKLSLWAGSFLAFPYIASQIWMFVAPGLYKSERRAFLPFLVATPILFLAGASLAYFFVFPLAWNFFLSFQTSGLSGWVESLPIQLEARVGEYLSLSMTLILAFGLTFEMPVLLVLLARIGVLSSAQLASFRRYAIVLIFVVAAVLTPPDVLSQFCLALPLMALYEISIWAARAVEKKGTGIEGQGVEKI
jgi:sec-independent protein translocase protein TatC